MLLKGLRLKTFTVATLHSGILAQEWINSLYSIGNCVLMSPCESPEIQRIRRTMLFCVLKFHHLGLEMDAYALLNLSLTVVILSLFCRKSKNVTV